MDRPSEQEARAAIATLNDYLQRHSQQSFEEQRCLDIPLIARVLRIEVVCSMNEQRDGKPELDQAVRTLRD